MLVTLETDEMYVFGPSKNSYEKSEVSKVK